MGVAPRVSPYGSRGVPSVRREQPGSHEDRACRERGLGDSTAREGHAVNGYTASRPTPVILS